MNSREDIPKGPSLPVEQTVAADQHKQLLINQQQMNDENDTNKVYNNQSDDDDGETRTKLTMNASFIPTDIATRSVLGAVGNATDPVAKTAITCPITDTEEKTELEYWERLPSKLLSFASAEILTVDECKQHEELYYQKAVRVTGMLHERNVNTETSQVVLKLKNPLKSLASNNNVNNRRNTPRRSLSGNASTPLLSPAGASSSSSSSLNQPAANQTKKRPLLSRGSLSSASKLLSSNSSIKRRRPPWFAKKPPGSKLMKTNAHIKPKIPTILTVVADPLLRNLSSLVLGSLVMVIGSVQDDGSIEARLVQNVNPTDMTLYVNSLKARRKFLYQRHIMLRTRKNQKGSNQQAGDQDDDNSNTSLVPIQGCGPPPYDHLMESSRM